MHGSTASTARHRTVLTAAQVYAAAPRRREGLAVQVARVLAPVRGFDFALDVMLGRPRSVGAVLSVDFGGRTTADLGQSNPMADMDEPAAPSVTAERTTMARPARLSLVEAGARLGLPLAFLAGSAASAACTALGASGLDPLRDDAFGVTDDSATFERIAMDRYAASELSPQLPARFPATCRFAAEDVHFAG
jgi:hypothetical protein